MTIPKRTAVLDAMPAKQSGRTAVDLSEWEKEITALRKEKAGKVFAYEGVEKPAALAQKLTKHFGIVAGSRGVDKKTKIGTLVIQNQDVEFEDEEDDSYTDEG